jgi:pyoverdine/dityrosine biosynthesis protein Dit1
MTLARCDDPDYTQLEGLSYLNNFCREVLRVYAPGMNPALSCWTRR